jgi:hypothetical protein
MSDSFAFVSKGKQPSESNPAINVRKASAGAESKALAVASNPFAMIFGYSGGYLIFCRDLH